MKRSVFAIVLIAAVVLVGCSEVSHEHTFGDWKLNESSGRLERVCTKCSEVESKEVLVANSQDSLMAAISNGSKPIYIASDIELSSTIEISDGQSIVIDLNGHTISAEELPFMIRHGNVEFTGKGTIQETESDGYGAILLKGSETDVADYSVVSVGKDVTLKGWAGIFVDQLNAKQGKAQAYGVVVNMHGTIIVPSESEHAAGLGIYLNGSVKDTEGNVPVFNIDGASITANSTGIYAAGYGKWNIKDTAISGVDTAIEIRAGVMDIESGMFSASAVPTEVSPNGNGTTSSGSAIAVSQHTTKLPVIVSISGGTFEGYSTFYESNPQKNSDEDIAKVQLNVTGGVFNAINGGSVAVYSEDCTGFISGGKFNIEPNSSYLAE